jgi:polygalacturonase
VILSWRTGLTAAISMGFLVAQARGTALPPPPPLPFVPQHRFNVERYGARPNGHTPATIAIQKAVHACEVAGGGIVVFPRGVFLSGPIRLGNHVELNLASGATLKMLPYGQYPLVDGRYPDFIRASHRHDIAITGRGTIDGQGAPWWTQYRRRSNGTVPHLPHRPQMIALNSVTRVLIEGVRLENPANTHISLQNACRDVTIKHIIIHTAHHSPNTDGIDVSGHNILISQCRISDGDDCIAIGGSGNQPQTMFESQNIVVTHCQFGYGHGMSIGSFTSGGIRNVMVVDCVFNRTTAGIRLKSNPGRGGLVENLLYKNIKMRSTRWPIFISSYYPHRPKEAWRLAPAPVGRMTPIWRNIRIINLTSTGSPIAGDICGLPGMPVKNVLLQNVHITAQRGMLIYDARGVYLKDCTIQTSFGPPLQIHAAQVTGWPGK